MIFRYSLREPSFSLVKNGIKTIEGRLFKNTFKKINKDDIINFYNYKKESIMTKVINIRKYNNFNIMIQTENLKLLNPLSKSTEESLNIYNKIYKCEDEIKYGVIALEIELI